MDCCIISYLSYLAIESIPSVLETKQHTICPTLSHLPPKQPY